MLIVSCSLLLNLDHLRHVGPDIDSAYRVNLYDSVKVGPLSATGICQEMHQENHYLGHTAPSQTEKTDYWRCFELLNLSLYQFSFFYYLTIYSGEETSFLIKKKCFRTF